MRQVHQTSVAAAAYGNELQIKSGKLSSELGNTAEECAIWLERSLVCKETESILKYEDYNSIAETYAATTLKYIGIGENGNPKFFYLAHLSKMSVLGEMASGIAHEILNARLKKKGHLEDLSLTSAISENCTRIAEIINGLRDFSRSENLDKCQEVNLKDLMGGIFPLCQHRFKAAEIAFDWSTINAKLTIFCRLVQISQVFINLLNNAHDAVKDPNFTLSVRIYSLQFPIKGTKIKEELLNEHRIPRLPRLVRSRDSHSPIIFRPLVGKGCSRIRTLRGQFKPNRA